MSANITAKEVSSQVDKAVALNRRVEIPCGNHLYLRITKQGLATWRLRFKTKESDRSGKLGTYPAMSLKMARNEANAILDKIAKDQERSQAFPTFRDYAQTWLSTFIPDPGAEQSHKNNKRYQNLKSQISHLKALGDLRLDEITPKEVDLALSNADCTQSAKYLSIRALNQLLNSAVVDGVIERNPCKAMLNTHGTLAVKYAKPKVKGFAWVPPSELGSKFFTPLASQPLINKVFYLLDAFTALRLTSCLSIQWDWIKAGRIMVPGEYMKMGRPFDVPTTPYIEALLSNWKADCDGRELGSKFVFPSRSDPAKSKRLQDVQVPVADLTHGETTIHGLRKSFRTWTAEYMINEKVADMALAHAKKKLEATYNKYDYFRERQEALCLWNEYLCRMLPDEYLILIDGIDPAQRAKFAAVLEEKEKAFAALDKAD